MNTTTIKGNWNIAKGKLKKKYAQLTDNDLTYVEGQEEELLGRIQKRTGQARAEIERFLKQECGWNFSPADHGDFAPTAAAPGGMEREARAGAPRPDEL